MSASPRTSASEAGEGESPNDRQRYRARAIVSDLQGSMRSQFRKSELLGSFLNHKARTKTARNHYVTSRRGSGTRPHAPQCTATRRRRRLRGSASHQTAVRGHPFPSGDQRRVPDPRLTSRRWRRGLN